MSGRDDAKAAELVAKAKAWFADAPAGVDADDRPGLAQAAAEHNDSIDAISDALHRAGVGDAPRLVDRIALAGEELHKLRRVVQERDGLRKRLEAARGDHESLWDEVADALGMPGEQATTRLANEARRLRALVGPSDDRDPPTEQRRERIRLRDELDAVRRRISELEEARDGYQNANTDLTAEHDSLRQQLEAARRDSDTYARDHRDSVEDEAKLAADLAAAQQRIAELEGELASARDDRGRLLGERVMFAAALGAIAPVWQTAAAEQMATAIPDENGQPMPCECASCCAVRTSLARLTPELLAVIEAVTR